MEQAKELDHIRIEWIREQGYFSHTDQQIHDLAFGNRFAYRLCALLITPAVVFAHTPTLAFINIIALASIFLPNHPFDYIYNELVRKWTGGAKLPRRSAQLKFACFMASLCLSSIIYCFSAGFQTVGYLLGLQMIAVVLLVSMFDLCLPSKLFNFFIAKKESLSGANGRKTG